MSRNPHVWRVVTFSFVSNDVVEMSLIQRHPFREANAFYGWDASHGGGGADVWPEG